MSQLSDVIELHEPEHDCLFPGVAAFSDQRRPAADPAGPGLGAFRSGPVCGDGGLHSQQVDWVASDKHCEMFSSNKL